MVEYKRQVTMLCSKLFSLNQAFKYLEDRGATINLRTAIRDIAYETGADGLPSKITGLQVRNELREFDAVVCACDLPGVKKVLPKPFRQFPAFDNIYELDAVPIATVQLRFDGWVTELQDSWINPPRSSRNKIRYIIWFKLAASDRTASSH